MIRELRERAGTDNKLGEPPEQPATDQPGDGSGGGCCGITGRGGENEGCGAILDEGTADVTAKMPEQSPAGRGGRGHSNRY